MDSLKAMRAPQPGEHVTVDGLVFARWATALTALSTVARDPAPLAAILERVALIPEIAVEVVGRPRRLRDRELRRLTDTDWCLPDTFVSVLLPETEGLATYARGAGLSAHACVGVPRAALRLHDDT